MEHCCKRHCVDRNICVTFVVDYAVRRFYSQFTGDCSKTCCYRFEPAQLCSSKVAANKFIGLSHIHGRKKMCNVILG